MTDPQPGDSYACPDPGGLLDVVYCLTVRRVEGDTAECYVLVLGAGEDDRVPKTRLVKVDEIRTMTRLP